MVNQQALKDQMAKAPANIQNGGEIYKHIFTKHPELQKHWDMEDIEPDQIAKSRQMQQKGASFLSSLNQLVSNLTNDKPFRLEIAELRDSYKEMGLKAADTKKFVPGVATFFEAKCGKLTDAQKKAWTEFFDKYSSSLKEAGLD